MFGHLSSDELMNLIEAGTLPERVRTHLNACPACQEKRRSIEMAYRAVSTADANAQGVPEPDWEDFRSSVRLELLSRSVKRDSTVRRWTGWSIRPAVAWSMSLLFAVFVATGGFLWHISQDKTRFTSPLSSDSAESAVNAPQVLQSPLISLTTDPAELEAAASPWIHSKVFEEADKLEGAQAEVFRKMLESAQQKGYVEQQ